MIPTRQEAEKMDMAGAWFHFNQRLRERYGIGVTLDEYLILRRENLSVLHKERNSNIGIMKIKGIDVLVVREKHRKKKLLTALPYNNVEKYV